MEAKHTKGPWTTGDADWRTIVGGVTRYATYTLPDGRIGASLGCVCTIDKTNDEAEDLANARLIAAAPDLLAACKDLLAFFDCARPGGRLLMTDPDAEAARAAIAKAEGAQG